MALIYILAKYIIDRIDIKYFLIDIQSSVITMSQNKAKSRYNYKKKHFYY